MVRNVGKQWISIVLLWHSKGKVETMSMGFNKNKVELLGHRYIIQC